MKGGVESRLEGGIYSFIAGENTIEQRRFFFGFWFELSIEIREFKLSIPLPAFKRRQKPHYLNLLEHQSWRLDRNFMSPSVTSLASGIGTAVRQLKAPTSIVCGPSLIVWSMKNGVSLRRTFSNVPIHGSQSLGRMSVRGTTLEDWAVVWAVKCFFHACGARYVLYTALADCVRTHALKITMVNSPWVSRVLPCR